MNRQEKDDLASVGERAFPEIPEAEGSGVKEVFAFFGLCAYCCQVLEHGILNWVAALRLHEATPSQISNAEWPFDTLDRKTLGQLIAEVRKHVDVAETIEVSMKRALEDRNYVMHRFFRTHDIDFGSDVGRRKMIDELREIAERVQSTDRITEPVTLALWERLGITKAMFEHQLERMEKESQAMDGSGKH